MHPRTVIRKALIAILTEILPGIPVFNARFRESAKSERDFVSIYTPSDYQDADFSTEYGPIRLMDREISVEILIATAVVGDEHGAADKGDDIARKIELALNGHPDLPGDMRPSGGEQGFATGADVRCFTTMRYTFQILDEMRSLS